MVIFVVYTKYDRCVRCRRLFSQLFVIIITCINYARAISNYRRIRDHKCLNLSLSLTNKPKSKFSFFSQLNYSLWLTLTNYTVECMQRNQCRRHSCRVLCRCFVDGIVPDAVDTNACRIRYDDAAVLLRVNDVEYRSLPSIRITYRMQSWNCIRMRIDFPLLLLHYRLSSSSMSETCMCVYIIIY